MAAELVDGRAGTILADRNYRSPKLKEELAQRSLNLQAQFKKASTEPWPRRSATISRFRYRIETVFGQLVDRYLIKRVWAKDMWHLGNRLLIKTLSHIIAFMLNQAQGNPPMHISKLVH